MSVTFTVLLNLEDQCRIWLYLSLIGSSKESCSLSYGTGRGGCLPEYKTDVDCTKEEEPDSTDSTVTFPKVVQVRLKLSGD